MLAKRFVAQPIGISWCFQWRHSRFKSSLPQLSNIYIYIYAWKKWILLYCFLSNPFFSYELGIFTWQSMYFQCTCFYSGYKKSLMKWQVVTHFSYIHRNLSSQLTLDHICENDDRFSRNVKLKHLAWGTNQSWIILRVAELSFMQNRFLTGAVYVGTLGTWVLEFVVELES